MVQTASLLGSITRVGYFVPVLDLYLMLYGLDVKELLYKKYMVMNAMVQIFSWGEIWNVLFNEVQPSWIEHFIFHRMYIYVPLQEWKNIHYLFYLTS